MDYKEQFEELIQTQRYEEAFIYLQKYQIHAYEEPYYYANMGWLSNHLEAYEQAERYLQKGLSLYKDDAWMYSQLGYTYDRQGKVKEGLVLLHRSLSLGFDEPWLHGEIGWCYKILKDYEQAIEYFENALLDDHQNVWLIAQAASVYTQMGERETAQEYYQLCYKYQSDDDSIYDLVQFYKQGEEYEKELQYLNMITKDTFQDWKAYELGVVYERLKDYEKAIEAFLNALSLGYSDITIYTLLGDCYQAVDKKQDANMHFEKALERYEEALMQEEDHNWIYQEMIWIAHKQADWDKKLVFLNRANEERPNNAWIMYHYARCYSEIKEYAKAVEACAHCIALGEDSKEMSDHYAWNLGRNKQELEAIDIMLARAKKFGYDAWLYGELGWDYAELKEYEKAKQHFYEATLLDGENEMYVSMLGWSYLQLKEYDRALHHLTIAQTMGRADEWLYCVLGEVHVGLLDAHTALQYFYKAKEMGNEESWVDAQIKQLEESVQKEEQAG